jgi:glycosyltransferase involved in cell wall biosynthesis
MKKTTAIICVYNEQDTVGNVIISTSKEQFINEIVVVNDGSTDNSKSIIDKLKNEYNLNVIHFDKNKGKGYAMAVGVENAKHDIVIFIDADQTSIKPNYTSGLILPLVNDECGNTNR